MIGGLFVPDAGWLLGLCAARMGFATMFTAYSAALPLLAVDWAMTSGESGLIQTAYHVGFLVSLFAVGFLSDHFGARRTFLWSSIAAAVSGLVFAVFADGFLSALLLYGLSGLCSGGSYTPGLALIAERFEGSGQGRAMGFYLAAASLGYALALFLASAMIPLAGWRGAFVATALGPLLAAVLGFLVLRRTPNVIHPLPHDHANRGAIRTVWHDKPVMLSIWGYVAHAWELLGLWAWLPAFLAAALAAGAVIGPEVASVGATLAAVTYLVAAAGNAAGGALSDHYGRTAVILAMSVASLLCSFTFGWMIGSPMWLLVLVAVLYNLLGVADSSIHSTALTELAPRRYLGAAYSLRSALGFGAGAVSPWVFGLVLDWGREAGLPSAAWTWGLAWMSLGIGGILGPIAILRLRRMPEAARMAGGRR